MKRIVLAAAAIMAFSGVSAYAQPWSERSPNDKILHFVWGAGTQVGLSLGASALKIPYGPEIGLAGAFATGIAKECVDKHFDPYDFAATAGGGLVSYVIDRTIRANYLSNIPKLEVGVQKNGAVLIASGHF